VPPVSSPSTYPQVGPYPPGFATPYGPAASPQPAPPTQPGSGLPPSGQPLPGSAAPTGYAAPPGYPTAPNQPLSAYPGQPGYAYPAPGYPQGYQQGGYPPAGYPQAAYPPPGYPQAPGYAYQPGQPPHGAAGQPPAPAAYPPYPNAGRYDPNASLAYYFPQAKPPRRRRTAVIVTAVVVVALVLCAGTIFGISRLGDPGVLTNSPNQSKSTSPPVKVDTSTMNGILYEQSQALLNGDQKGFLASIDPAATAAVAAFKRIYHNMRQMHVTIWEQSAPAGNYVTEEPQSYEVDVTYCLVVRNCQETDATWHVTAELKAGRATIESFTPPEASRYTSEPFPWEISTLTALTGPRVVVAASDAEAGTLRRALAIAERASKAADQYAHWGKPAVYVLYIADPAEGKAWFDGDLQNADGVTYSIQPHDLEVVALMPDADDPSYAGPGALNAVVQHEFGHVATLLGDDSDRGHDSFIEGIAEYCAYTGHTSWAAYRLEDVRSYIRSGKWQHSIYMTSEITSKSVLTGSAAYGIGYLGLRYIAETYGVNKMLDFWGAVERQSESLDQASQTILGKPWATVDTAAVAYVVHAVNA
jgi:hypothetical protein